VAIGKNRSRLERRVKYLRDEPRADPSKPLGAARPKTVGQLNCLTPTPQRQVRWGAAGNRTALASRLLTTMSSTEVAPVIIAEAETSAAAADVLAAHSSDAGVAPSSQVTTRYATRNCR